MMERAWSDPGIKLMPDPVIVVALSVEDDTTTTPSTYTEQEIVADDLVNTNW
jgi:hypothetical protein